MSDVTVGFDVIDEKIEEIQSSREEVVARLQEAESAVVTLRKMLDRQDGALAGLTELKSTNEEEVVEEEEREEMKQMKLIKF